MDTPHESLATPKPKETTATATATATTGTATAATTGTATAATTATTATATISTTGTASCNNKSSVAESAVRKESKVRTDERKRRRGRPRGPKPRSQRNRKKARGCGVGLGPFVGDDANSNDNDNDADDTDDPPVEVVLVDPREVEDPTMMIGSNQPKIRIRIVKPYPYTHATFVKQRWIGRTVLDIFCREFGSYPKVYYESALRCGRIRVNSKVVPASCILQSGDEVSHTVHRHEPAVAVSSFPSSSSCDYPNHSHTHSHTHNHSHECVRIVHEDERVVVVDKPSTVPIHPCGAYHFNSLFHILQQQRQQQDQNHKSVSNYNSNSNNNNDKLFTVHRLDRLTSGLVVCAKTSQVAKEMGVLIMQRHCQKFYLARVKGRFGLGSESVDNDNKNNVTDVNCDSDVNSRNSLSLSQLSRLRGHDSQPPAVDGILIDHKGCDTMAAMACGYWLTDATGAVDDEVSLEDAFSLVSNDNNNNSNNNNNNNTTNLDASTIHQYVKEMQRQYAFDEHNNNNNEINNNEINNNEINNNEINNNEINNNEINNNEINNNENKYLRYCLHVAFPCRIVSHKDGICETIPTNATTTTTTAATSTSTSTNDDNGSTKTKTDAKPAQTSFVPLWYDQDTNTTVVLCRPTTGRTHQIRLHLQRLGHPIANDPNYGGNKNFHFHPGTERARQRLAEMNTNNQLYHNNNNNKDNNPDPPPDHSYAIADVPATEREIVLAETYARANHNHNHNHNHNNNNNNNKVDVNGPMVPWTLHSLCASCVWCHRSNGERYEHERTLLELAVRSPGIWLHALQYSFGDHHNNKNNNKHDNGNNDNKHDNNDNSQQQTHTFCTEPPDWALFPTPTNTAQTMET